MGSKRSNGEGTLYWNEGRKRWEGQIVVGWDADRNPRRRKFTGPTRAAVIDKMDVAKRAIAQGLEIPDPKRTVAQFLDWWLDEVLPGTVRNSTERQYRDVVRLYLNPHLGGVALTKLTPAHVTRMLNALGAEGKAPSTRRTARTVLRRALRSAEVQGWVPRNVARLADGPKQVPSRGRALNAEQAVALIHAAKGHRYEAAVTVALACGLRRSELLGLAWSDLDLNGAFMTVRRTLVKVGGQSELTDLAKTATSRRTIRLPVVAVTALRTHRARQAAERLAAGSLWHQQQVDLVFTSTIGTPINPDNFRNRVYELTESAGIGRWSPHELRHSAASLLLAQGIPLKVVSEVLGHSSIRVTADVYGHLEPPAFAQAADAMDTALTSPPTTTAGA